MIKTIAKIGISVLTVLLILALGIFLTELIFAKTGTYQELPETKQELFSGHTVMLFAPHQDDEINIAGSLLERYVRCGSEVYIVYTTNGDTDQTVETRLEEGINSARMIGIDESHIILMGYGDGWDMMGPEIYVAQPDQVLISKAGYMETHGTASHTAYHDDTPYTRNNYLSDFKSLLLEYRPDVIFCCDFDPHHDHRATSMLLEEALGVILNENGDYRPLVLKSLAYDTSYYSEADFYSPNILSTKNPFDTDYTQPASVYSWDSRLRLPVESSSLSRSLFSCKTYQQLRQFVSQGAMVLADRIISGDRTFFIRRTDSCLYDAKMSDEKLKDFKLVESCDLEDYCSGTCAGDTFTVELKTPCEIEEIWLYDNPSSEQNILNAVITLDSGRQIRTGELNPYGQATPVSIGGETVSSFRIEVLEKEGDQAGLTEIEAYQSAEYEKEPGFIKIMNDQGDFAYDYLIDSSGEEHFKVYCSGDARGPFVTEEAQDADGFTVYCEKGQSRVVTVQTADGRYQDTIIVSNPRFTLCRGIGQKLEMKINEVYYSLLSVVYHN